MSKNDFLKQYSDLPEVGAIRFIIFGTFLLINIVNFMVIYMFEIDRLGHVLWDFKMSIFAGVVLVLNLWGAAIFAFPKKMGNFFYLYIAVAFCLTSLYYLYVSNSLVALVTDKPLLFIVLSILIYILIIAGVIKNIMNKIKKGRRAVTNNRLVPTIALSAGAMGIFLAKTIKLDSNDIPLALVLLLLSYTFIFTGSGFHKFYLGNRRIKK